MLMNDKNRSSHAMQECCASYKKHQNSSCRLKHSHQKPWISFIPSNQGQDKVSDRNWIKKTLKTSAGKLLPCLLPFIRLSVQMVNKGADLTDKALRKKALRLASKENIPRDKFSASVGWLTKFKKRHGIRIFKQHGEAQEANQEGIELSRTELPKYIEAKVSTLAYHLDCN